MIGCHLNYAVLHYVDCMKLSICIVINGLGFLPYSYNYPIFLHCVSASVNLRLIAQPPAFTQITQICWMFPSVDLPQPVQNLIDGIVWIPIYRAATTSLG